MSTGRSSVESFDLNVMITFSGSAQNAAHPSECHEKCRIQRHQSQQLISVYDRFVSRGGGRNWGGGGGGG